MTVLVESGVAKGDEAGVNVGAGLGEFGDKGFAIVADEFDAGYAEGTTDVGNMRNLIFILIFFINDIVVNERETRGTNVNDDGFAARKKDFEGIGGVGIVGGEGRENVGFKADEDEDGQKDDEGEDDEGEF